MKRKFPRILVLLFSLAASPLAHAGDPAEPLELTKLRADWNLARLRALQPVDRKYVQALEALKDRFQKAGKTSEAEKIEAELTAVRMGEKDESAAGGSKVKGELTKEQLLEERWRFHMTENGFTTHFLFTKDGKVFNQGTKEEGTWILRGGKLRVTYKTVWNVFDASYDPTGKQVVLVEKESQAGEREGVTLTQVPLAK